MMWNRCCLKTWSTTQTVVALSSGEAEYYAALKGASQGLGMQSMLAELGVDLEVVVHTDANACSGISGRQGLGKLRHIAVTLLWLQDVMKQRRIQLVKVPGTENPADAMTKYLSRVDMERCLKAMGHGLRALRGKNELHRGDLVLKSRIAPEFPRSRARGSVGVTLVNYSTV